ncbi:FecR domain-containing protein [Sphingorhabdus arenilitoris]|uniref:FecR domain-containing protein n=1 Tax=Sphingorhabdus arenilitoris TaxID=1490041 RepID=A0ABV8RBT4_9SPHN
MSSIIGRFLFLSCCALFSVAFAATSASAADEDTIIYTVKRGDTLIGLGNNYLAAPGNYRIVQRENAIRNPRFLPIGQTIRIRRDLLKYKAENARILSVRGNVTLLSGNSSGAAQNGQIVAEGMRITTGGSSFVTLGLSNGSRISLPSNSDVRVRLLRSYILGGSIDYDFDIVKGGTRSKVVPHKNKDDRYRVRTPKAVSAVRGTDFQSRYDSDTDRDFAEVVEGALAVGTASSDGVTDLPAGQGIALSQDGNVIREALLPEPKLIDPGKLQADPAILFAADPAAGESGYRFTLSSDAGFVDQIADIVTLDKQASFDGLDNGNYFVRARAIAGSGIQGQPVTFAFKRRLNGVKGSAGKGDDGYNFKWLSEGEGKRSFHFQLFSGQPGGVAIADETALSAGEISISDLPPGTYFWRVGAVQYLDNEVSTNWTDFEKLSIAP